MMKKKNLRHQAIAIMLLVTVSIFMEGCEKSIFDDHSGEGTIVGAASRSKGTVATDWYDLQLQMIIKANPAINPILLSRAWGYIGIGLYESVRPGINHSISLSQKLYQMPPMPQKQNNNGYSWEVSANAALAKLITCFYPEAVVSANQQRIDSLEAAYNNSLRPGVESAVFARSQAFGQAIADAVIAWSQTDNSNLGNAGYVPPVFPGAWEPTAKGRPTDVYVKFIPREEALVMAGGITYMAQSGEDKDACFSEYGKHSVSIRIWIFSQALSALSHELGHVNYQVPNLETYTEYYKRMYQPFSTESNHLGHAGNDRSGKTAITFEKEFKKDYVNYLRLREDNTRLESPLVLMNEIRAKIKNDQLSVVM